MRVRVSEEIKANRIELLRLIRDGFEGVDADGVEVHLEPSRRPGESFTGRAYFRLPSRPRTRPGTLWLVRLKVPAVFRNRAYPRTYRYERRKTAPWITVGDWRERLVALVAHEAFHVHQFREGLRRSEVQAERWAADVLQAWQSRLPSVVAVRTDPVPEPSEQLVFSV
jgi:hypothetical protein